MLRAIGERRARRARLVGRPPQLGRRDCLKDPIAGVADRIERAPTRASVEFAIEFKLGD
jgi:hypothetical protein